MQKADSLEETLMLGKIEVKRKMRQQRMRLLDSIIKSMDINLSSLGTQMVKRLPAMQETWVRIPGLGRSPGGGYGNPLQYSCLENLHEQRSLAGYTVHRVSKESDTTW